MEEMTEEERRKKKAEYAREYRKQHPEYLLIRNPMRRADYLLQAYKQKDKLRGRGNSDLTAKWLVENILFKPCAHCGKEGWDIIGCNRLDNSKPHTKDNVEPCCEDCNNKLNWETQFKKVYQYTLDGELVKVWESVTELSKNGYTYNKICTACRGKFYSKKRNKWYYTDKYKGYRWSYTPL